MATVRRRVNVRKRTTAPAQKRMSRYNENSIGGSSEVIGNTADLADLTSLVSIQKNVYGLFEDGFRPNYTVVEGTPIAEAGFWALNPVYPYKDLQRVYLASTILRQCVDSYVTNIEAYGYELEYIGPEGERDGRAAQNEKMRIQRLMGTLTSDGRTLQKHREDSRVDKEVLGGRSFEIIRDAGGRVVGFDHVPTVTLKMTNKEKKAIPVSATDPVTGSSKTVLRRFRRFIQVDEYGVATWFKELGDPRPINPKTGKVDPNLSIEEEATEIYYEGLYCPGTPYGVPRWVGAIPSQLGAREAEMVNLNFFRDNAIPAMAVLVSGGALTEESFEKIESYIAGVRGAASMNRIVVMEAVSDGSEAAAIDGSLPAPKIDIKPMLSERQHEGLFGVYISDANTKARQTFRLPPIYIGSAGEYNRASAFASMLTADNQIFVPERVAWDTMFYNVVLSTHRITFWRVRSTGPGMQDPAEVARIVNSLGREGAFTPNIAIKLANRFLDADIEPVKQEWGDTPFSIISQYVKAGKIVDGLDVFEEDLNAVVPGDPANVDPVNADNLDSVQKVVRRLLDEVSVTMQKQLDDALQSIAAEKENA